MCCLDMLEWNAFLIKWTICKILMIDMLVTEIKLNCKLNINA